MEQNCNVIDNAPLLPIPQLSAQLTDPVGAYKDLLAASPTNGPSAEALALLPQQSVFSTNSPAKHRLDWQPETASQNCVADNGNTGIKAYAQHHIASLQHCYATNWLAALLCTIKEPVVCSHLFYSSVSKLLHHP